MRLFDRFDKVFLINLKRRKDRLDFFQSQVDKFDLGNFEVVEAVDTSNESNRNKRMMPGAYGLIETNIKIFEKSIEENYETICIIEDDCMFLDEINNVEYYYNYLPQDWDMLYYGCNHNYHAPNFPRPIMINEHVLKLQHSHSAHFVVIKKTMYEKIKSFICNFHGPLDVMYVKFQLENNVYSFNPNLTTQKPGFSDIELVDVNYLNIIN